MEFEIAVEMFMMRSYRHICLHCCEYWSIMSKNESSYVQAPGGLEPSIAREQAACAREQPGLMSSR